MASLLRTNALIPWSSRGASPRSPDADPPAEVLMTSSVPTSPCSTRESAANGRASRHPSALAARTGDSTSSSGAKSV